METWAQPKTSRKDQELRQEFSRKEREGIEDRKKQRKKKKKTPRKKFIE